MERLALRRASIKRFDLPWSGARQREVQIFMAACQRRTIQGRSRLKLLNVSERLPAIVCLLCGSVGVMAGAYRRTDQISDVRPPQGLQHGPGKRRQRNAKRGSGESYKSAGRIRIGVSAKYL